MTSRWHVYKFTSSRSVSYCRLWVGGCEVSLFRSTISIHPTHTINYISSSCGQWAGGCSDSVRGIRAPAIRAPACTSPDPCTLRQTLALFAYTISIRLTCYLWARSREVHINSQNRVSRRPNFPWCSCFAPIRFM